MSQRYQKVESLVLSVSCLSISTDWSGRWWWDGDYGTVVQRVSRRKKRVTESNGRAAASALPWQPRVRGIFLLLCLIFSGFLSKSYRWSGSCLSFSFLFFWAPSLNSMERCIEGISCYRICRALTSNEDSVVDPSLNVSVS